MQNIGGSQVFEYAVFAYAAAYVCYLAYAIFRRRAIGYVATGLLAAGWVIHSVFMVERVQWYYQQHQTFVLPSTNMFEVIGYFAWLIVLAYLIAEQVLFKSRAFGFIALVVPLAAVAYASHSMAPDPRELMPSLKSYWLKYHITAMIISYALFALSAAFAFTYVLRARGLKALENIDRRYNLRFLDETSYRLVLVGFPVLTLGVGLGAVWAHDAWGRYWGWDPKEVWALITWLVYLSYLHFRLQRSWVGYRSALMNMVGFASVMITFQGVNLLDGMFKLNSIHAYTMGEGTGRWETFFLALLFLCALIPIVLLMLPKPPDDLRSREEEILRGLERKDEAPVGGPSGDGLQPAKPHAKDDKQGNEHNEAKRK
jgi:cytochrome c-type biogenesis protein CcsB